MISIPADVLFEEEKNLVFNRQDRNEKAVKYFYTKRRQKIKDEQLPCGREWG
tara:strand:- start:250 stop:405 length:156 start_codon:yes stop_codon:yes gene_type:complete